ncbi:MAG: PhnD/SsuA/transferrin family substrate-binding protein [Gemmatales bacterium]|nr:phosphate/phosphite/phosphonate ABC transporter substrate-binding protein [Gemmatales bacterium]MDW7993182.1 PhnD/SsuA/transferrin family substrate-binding protein [Gemmatales bacterium]
MRQQPPLVCETLRCCVAWLGALLIGAVITANALRLQEPIGVGMIASLFDQTDEKTILAQMQPFADVVSKRVGVRGEFVVVRDVEHAAKLLDERKIQVIVLHSPEYGWLKHLDKEIRPLLIATASVPKLQAVLLVHQSATVTSPEDLKGKTLALASRLPQHLRLYLERRFPEPADKFFRILVVKSAEDSLEAVIEGKADLTVVSNMQMEVYQQQRPGRFKRLRALESSPEFPMPVVAYKPQKGLEDVVESFRQSLLTAKETPEGRQTLVLWRIEAFQDPPADYEEQAAKIAELYPFKPASR